MNRTAPRTAVRLVRKKLLPLAVLVLSLPLMTGSATGDGPERPADRSISISTRTPLGESQIVEVPEGHVAYEVGGAAGRTTTVASGPGFQNVIVRLHGPSLAHQREALGRQDATARSGALRASGFQVMAAAAEAIDAQHERVKQAIAELEQAPGARALSAGSASITAEYRDTFNGFALTAPASLIERLRANPEVADIRPDTIMYADLEQSVPIIRAPELHGQGFTGAGVVVGILDTGIDYRHPDLGGGIGPGFKVIGGYDFINNDNDPIDDNRHGTHVAGIVAANGVRKGVAPDAKLVAYKVLGAGGSGPTSGIIRAIERAANPDGDPTTDDALDIINLSLGGAGDADDPLSLAIDGAAADGVLPVVAAGNAGGYQTIGSPGTARRALTVGSTDKQDRISSFSSRGPANKTFDVKPDVVAPGSSIISTLPNGASGPLSGTSMATPHVAGAAALLLQARPGLSPETLKSILMTSAVDRALDIFTQGAGRIDVVAASQRRTVVSPATLGFGAVDITLPTFTASGTLSVTNIGDATRQYTATFVNTGLPAGVGLTLTPSVLDLAPGATGTITAALTVDNATVPIQTRDPLAYSGRIQLAAADETLNVPFAFLKGAMLDLTFDATPFQVTAVSSTGAVINRQPSGRALKMLLAPGTYDVYTTFLTVPAPSRFRYSLVSRNVTVETVTAVNVRSTEAVNVLRPAPVNELGVAVTAPRTQRTVLRRNDIDFDTALTIGAPGIIEYAYATLDARHLVDWMLIDEPVAAPTKSYSFYWHRAGIAASETLANTPADLKNLEFQFDAAPGITSAAIARLHTGVADQFTTSTITRVTLAPPFRWHRLVMPKPAGASLFGFAENWVDAALPGAPPQFLHATPMFHTDGTTTTASFIDINFEALRFETRPLYQTSRTHFDIGLEPVAWAGRLENTASSVRVRPAIGIDSWLFHDQTMDSYFTPTLPYELRQGATVIRTGTFSGTGSTPPALPVTPGRYTLTIQGPSGTLEGVATGTKVTTTFDTSAVDRNPPTVTHFRILASGKPAKSFCITERAEIRFKAKDDVALGAVRLSFRLGNGGWLPWPLVRRGDELTAFLPLGGAGWPDLCAGVNRPVPISIRIEAADRQGNRLETEMTPAYARLIPQLHVAPLVLQTP